jgi:hypothetical protein
VLPSSKSLFAKSKILRYCYIRDSLLKGEAQYG